MKAISTTYGKLLTWWEDGALRVELRHHRGAFQVRTLRAEQVTAEFAAETETEARRLFERVVEEKQL